MSDHPDRYPHDERRRRESTASLRRDRTRHRRGRGRRRDATSVEGRRRPTPCPPILSTQIPPSRCSRHRLCHHHSSSSPSCLSRPPIPPAVHARPPVQPAPLVVLCSSVCHFLARSGFYGAVRRVECRMLLFSPNRPETTT